MTKLLQEAFAEVQRLSDVDQDAIAMLINDELADERHWQSTFANSQDLLARLAAEARENIRTGQVKAGGFDQL